jgi:hypothetical protein
VIFLEREGQCDVLTGDGLIGTITKELYCSRDIRGNGLHEQFVAL